MPIVYKCHNCGAILYEVRIGEVKVRKCRRWRNRRALSWCVTVSLEVRGASKYSGLLSPDDVINMNGGRCPYCGAELKLRRIRIEVR